MSYLTCECGGRLKPSLIEDWKYICLDCNNVMESKQIKLLIDKRHYKLKKKTICSCGQKMEWHSGLEEWVCSRKLSLQRKLRYLE